MDGQRARDLAARVGRRKTTLTAMALILVAGSLTAAENVRSWGTGWYGQLGNGISYFWETGPFSTPAQVPGMTNVKAVATGAGFSVVVKKDGSVYAWGSINGSNVPAPVSGLTGVVDVAAGGSVLNWEPWTPYPQALFLKGDGTVWSLTDSNASPKAVPGLIGVKGIAVGSDDSFAIKADGTLWRWCHWCTDGSQVPAQVAGVTNVKAMAADAWGTAFLLKTDGTVWTWQIWGSDPPVQIANLTGVVAISPYIALKSDGTAWLLNWGDEGWTTYSSINNVRAVAPWFVVRNGGSVWEYGDFDYDDDSEWRAVNGVGGVTSISVPSLSISGQRLALKSDGTVWSWGGGRWGQLGNGASLTTTVARGAKNISDVVGVSGGDAHSLALKYDGTVWNWGCEWVSNEPTSYDLLQPCGSELRLLPQTVTNASGTSPISGVVSIAAGGTHSLALKKDGTLLAWGRNNAGQLGNGQTDDWWGWGSQAYEPVAVSNLSGVVAIAAGGVTTEGLVSEELSGHSLALKNNGTVWTWGFNGSGQLGHGNETNTNVPVKVESLTGVVALAGGHLHSLALKSDGTVWAWGWNGFGQLGTGNRVRSNVPVKVANLTGVVAIAAGENFSLALRSDGTVQGWGANFSGQLGTGNTTSSNVPVAMKNLTNVAAIAAGSGRSLALRNNGSVWATGCQAFAASEACIGITSKVPVQVANLPGALAIAAGGGHNLAVLAGSVPGLTLNSKSIAFAAQGVGTTSAAKSLQITNSGNRPLDIAAVTVLGVDAAEFSKTVDNCSTAVLSPAASCSLSVKFAPGAPGARTAALVINSNAPGSNHLVPLSGTGSGSAGITVTAPNTAVNWGVGTDQLIQWTHTLGANTFVKIEFSRDAGATWASIAASAQNTGSYLWKVSAPATSKARIRVSSVATPAIQDASNVNFTIAAAFIMVTKPNGGETWKKNSTQTVTWKSNLGTSEFVKIELSTNGGASWLAVAEAAQAAAEEATVDPLGTLVGSTPSDGSQQVVLPATTSNKCRVRVTWLDNTAVTDVSNANFAIIP